MLKARWVKCTCWQYSWWRNSVKRSAFGECTGNTISILGFGSWWIVPPDISSPAIEQEEWTRKNLLACWSRRCWREVGNHTKVFFTSRNARRWCCCCWGNEREHFRRSVEKSGRDTYGHWQNANNRMCNKWYNGGDVGCKRSVRLDSAVSRRRCISVFSTVRVALQDWLVNDCLAARTRQANAMVVIDNVSRTTITPPPLVDENSRRYYARSDNNK